MAAGPRSGTSSVSAAGPARGDRTAAAAGPSAHAGLYGVFGVGGLAYSVMFTFLAPFALLHGIHAVRAFFVAYTVAALSVRVLGARLSDRLGHARMLRLAVPMYGVALVLMGLLGPSALLGIGVFFGVAHGAVFPALVATLVGTATPDRRPRALGLANGAMSLGIGAVFPAGMLVERLGYPAVFVATGALTVAAVILVPRRAKSPLAES